MLWILLLNNSVVSNRIDVDPASRGIDRVFVYETKEISLQCEQDHENYYTDVECWVDLKGPGFNKRIYGFWDGGSQYKVRVVGNSPGKWEWESGSNTEDQGLNRRKGTFEAVSWPEVELKKNQNRRGFLKVHENRRTLTYGDGTRFFMIADTIWAAATWRVPWGKEDLRSEYVNYPQDGISFQELVLNRKKHGFNALGIISCFPNWIKDEKGRVLIDSNGVQLRNGWGRPGSLSIANMEDENGQYPFEFPGRSPDPASANLDRINPTYFQSLDRKIQFLNEHGFVVFLESIRRDLGAYIDYYYDENEAVTRFINYLVARYGSYNVIFSALHTDSFMGDYQKSREYWKSFWSPIPAHYVNRYGHPPFGQLFTALGPIDTVTGFDNADWLMLHNCGNGKRDNSDMEILFQIYQMGEKPVFMSEGYYPGWKLGDKYVTPPVEELGSDYDNYCGRVHFWSSVFNGSLLGGIYGSGAYACPRRIEGEIDFNGVYLDEALNYEAGKSMRYLRELVEYCGDRWERLEPVRDGVTNGKSEFYNVEGLFGLVSVLRTEDRKFALVHFQAKTELGIRLTGVLLPGKYSVKWFNPKNGKWHVAEEKILIDEEFLVPEFSFSDSDGLEDRVSVIELVEGPDQ